MLSKKELDEDIIIWEPFDRWDHKRLIEHIENTKESLELLLEEDFQDRLNKKKRG